jgi:hypothetical protein
MGAIVFRGLFYYNVMGSRAHCVALMAEGLKFREVDLWAQTRGQLARN